MVPLSDIKLFESMIARVNIAELITAMMTRSD
jgi:hypothetical protein